MKHRILEIKAVVSIECLYVRDCSNADTSIQTSPCLSSSHLNSCITSQSARKQDSMTTPVGKLPPLPPLKTSPQNSPAIISAPRSPTSSTHGDVDEVPPRSQLRAAYPSYKARVSASIPKGKRVSSSSSRRLSLTEDSSEFDPESEEESQRKYKHSGVAISAALDAHWKRARQVYHRPSRKNSSEIALFDDAVSNPMPKPGMKLRKGQKDPSTDQNAAIKLQSIRAEDAEHSDEEARRYLINPDDTYVPRPTHIGNMTDLYITNPSDDEDHEPERREEKISLTDALRSNPPTQRRDFETEKDPKNGSLSCFSSVRSKWFQRLRLSRKVES